ncbi:conserved hypothetical protein [Leishmania mexicana MHOM/GT/2001/U1103]|uniref:Uncharacterized protein n=1 Tax=Leishmania mexicana (strain MHOM/GT/2001/U1103) TaxID=929439 RepID=E9B1V2_LEIMU|nr:conserved hypothetical protein [Leishmania mexicana MHOM/GT/2001/U1103]CBZ29209.1 conserved hypothetical protein [Leishmania mexicana MHOM/GT/2001/U1103]
MGTAPSAEIVVDAPFRVPQSGVRQVALIPIVDSYFPTPDCPLFRQLYEAYTDPSVRYYMRPNFDGKSGDLSRIPPIENSREDMHRLLLRHTAQGMFPTNAAVREVYEVGDFYRIRPVLCAVVFLYEGTNYVPEGSVQLPSPNRGGASAFAKVIGIIGDTCTLVKRPDDPLIPFQRDDVLKIRTLIMKSAGDHNMSRVVLLAAYIYYHQCCRIIGLPNVPALAASFTCFKTNIPFLCFLREMRDRMANVLEAPKNSKFYIDEYCLHGAVSREYVAKMMPAVACYYISFLKAKSEQRVLKQLSHQQPILAGCAGKERAGLTGKVLMNRAETRVGSVYTDVSNDHASLAVKVAALEGALKSGSNTSPKITYVVKGYVTRAVTSISNWSHTANEVYVVCVNSTVTVVDRASVEALDGPTHTPSLAHQPDLSEDAEVANGTTSAVVETLQVRRGDILSFYVPPSTRSTGASPTLRVTAAHDLSEDDDIFYGTPHLEALKFCSNNTSSSSSEAPSRCGSAGLTLDPAKGASDEDSASAAATHSSGATGLDGNAAPFEAKKGSWRVDDNIFIESVLLSLVRDECKLAREATEQDPGWVYDDVSRSCVHDGSFYVWHFRRGHEDFYYGTVPKFANPNRQSSRKNGGCSSGNAEQGKVDRGGVGGAGAARDPNSGLHNIGARGQNDKSPMLSPTPAVNAGKTPTGALPPSVPPVHRQNILSQPLQSSKLPQKGTLLPFTLSAASPDVQQAYLASIAAGVSLPQPPAYDASVHSAVQAAPNPFTSSVGQGHLNSMYATYPAEAAAMAAAGAPMMYTFMPISQGPGQMSPAPQQQLHTLPPQGMYSHGVSPLPPSPSPQQAVWSVAGAGNGQGTTPTSQSVGTCLVNALGQLISVDGSMGSEVAPAPQVSYTPSVATAAPQPYPSYVMVNGQLCILQSTATGATAAAPSSLLPYQQHPHMMAFGQ